MNTATQPTRSASGNRRKSQPGDISLQFGNSRKSRPAVKRDTLLTFMANTRKVQYKPTPSKVSFLRNVLSLFL